jgi:hypothetical protein
MPVLPVVFTAADGYPSIRYDPITWGQAAAMLAPSSGCDQPTTEAMQVARDAGRALYGERVGIGHIEPVNPIHYTAAYAQAGARAVWALAVAEGRRQAAEDLAAYAENYPESVFPADAVSRDGIAGCAMRHAYRNAAKIAETPRQDT